MAKILDRLPILTHDELVFVRDERITVKAHEILIWVSITREETADWPEGTPCFPALLDTAHTHNFSLTAEHFQRWSGGLLERFRELGNIRQAGKRLPLHSAAVWLHRNEPGKFEPRRDLPPECLDMRTGIAVYPKGSDFPRLPLLGTRALVANRLHLNVDGERKLVHLRTPDWRTWLGQWLA